MPVSEIQSEDYNCNIRRYVDNAPPPEPHDLRAHQQIKAGLMHDLFTRGVTPDGQLRPTRTQAPQLYQSSPLGWIPKDWEVSHAGTFIRPDAD